MWQDNTCVSPTSGVEQLHRLLPAFQDGWFSHPGSSSDRQVGLRSAFWQPGLRAGHFKSTCWHYSTQKLSRTTGVTTRGLLGYHLRKEEQVPTGLPQIHFLFGQFSGSSLKTIPVTFWSIPQCFILDEGICLCGKGLRCPGRGGKGVCCVLLTICRCTLSVISARRPEEPSPAGPREEAEDFRATDSGVTKFLRADSDIYIITLDKSGGNMLNEAVQVFAKNAAVIYQLHRYSCIPTRFIVVC